MSQNRPSTPNTEIELPRKKADKVRLYKLIKAKMIARARVDPAYFIEYVLANEKTGKAITNAPFHREWQEFLSSAQWGVILAPIEHGKTFQISIGRTLFELGRNPDLRILILGRNGDAAEKPVRIIRQQIEYNQRLHEVFPNLVRSHRIGDPWRDSDITVERTYYSKEPSIQARGMGSKNILGSRLDFVVFDDGLDLENTHTKDARDATEEWWDTVIFSRLVDDYETQTFGRIFAIGTPFDGDDLLHRLGSRPGWRMANYSAVENPDDPPEEWRPIWPRVWPLERLLKKRAGMTITAFARLLLCQLLDAATRRCKKAWLEHTKWLGRDRTLLRSKPTENGHPMRCFTGLDIGVGKKETDARSCLFTWAVTSKRKRVVVDVRSGHWSGPDILEECRKVAERYDSEVLVEGNAAQRFIAEFAVDIHGLFARAINTGTEKWDENVGVESLFVLMKNGYIVTPSGPGGLEVDAEVQAWLDECYEFSPTKHSGDRLMASWIADKGVRELIAERSDDQSDHMRR